ncbi:hypothetical protein EYA88_05485 [Burkholderia pseudomallei]|nr:hypothetical protein EYA88_05485 [Burkholderia pseudomallei]
MPRGARARQTASNTPDYGLAARRPHTENPCPRRWGWGGSGSGSGSGSRVGAQEYASVPT